MMGEDVPVWSEMQKEEPSTSVTAPGPVGPAALSKFHPAIIGSLGRNLSHRFD